MRQTGLRAWACGHAGMSVGRAGGIGDLALGQAPYPYPRRRARRRRVARRFGCRSGGAVVRLGGLSTIRRPACPWSSASGTDPAREGPGRPAAGPVRERAAARRSRGGCQRDERRSKTTTTSSGHAIPVTRSAPNRHAQAGSTSQYTALRGTSTASNRPFSRARLRASADDVGLPGRAGCVAGRRRRRRMRSTPATAAPPCAPPCAPGVARREGGRRRLPLGASPSPLLAHAGWSSRRMIDADCMISGDCMISSREGVTGCPSCWARRRPRGGRARPRRAGLARPP